MRIRDWSSDVCSSDLATLQPGWTSQHKLSGIAHALWAVRYDAKGDHFAAGVPEPQWIGKWVRVYDPRKDSTYPGGSGSHRALNESTYEWSDNPALHALTWALGRWENGRSEEHTSELQSLMRISYAVFCLKKKKTKAHNKIT